MDILEAIRTRRSVRLYDERPLEHEKLEELRRLVEDCNKEGNLHIQLVTDDPAAFDSRLAHYGKFRGVRHYFAMVGKKAPDLSERIGYHGERLVLRAEQLGLNTCWVALTYSRRKAAIQVERGEKCLCVISLGYGAEHPRRHKSKTYEQVAVAPDDSPAWFRRGVEAALHAPTAVNQQQFRFRLEGRRVRAEAKWGFYSRIDLGIVRLHFELGAGRENFDWA